MRLLTFLIFVILLLIIIAADAQTFNPLHKPIKTIFQKEADKQADSLLVLLSKYGDQGFDKWLSTKRNKTYFSMDAYIDNDEEIVAESIEYDSAAFFKKEDVESISIGYASNNKYCVVLIFAF